jgi:hypothetical protein
MLISDTIDFKRNIYTNRKSSIAINDSKVNYSRTLNNYKVICIKKHQKSNH